ncbi:MAG TPA: hypothetical protein VN939_19880 [Chthoniobacterales bacterium]|nr:hypothetical protein [Chthoniobacterales bacterium]
MNRPDQLLAQLVGRTHSFKNQTGLTSRQICQLTDINEQHLCDFITGREGLSLTSTLPPVAAFDANSSGKAADRSDVLFGRVAVTVEI